MKLEDMLIVALVFLVLFGGSRIPQLGAGLGKGIRAFKRGLEGGGEEPAPPADGAAGERERDPSLPGGARRGGG